MLTIHHLQHSQSERMLWLLEELAIPYELVIHQRDPLLSPPSLKAIHPMGSAPVIVDGDLVLSESAAIAHYIINKYGGGRLITKPEDPNYANYLFWLYFVLCTLQPVGSTTMLAYFDKALPEDAMAKAFPKQRFLRNLSLVEKRLGEGVPFLAGEQFTLVDIMAVWVFTTFRDFLPYSLKDFPNIIKYSSRMTSRDAYKKAWEKGEEGKWDGIKEVEPLKPAVF